MYYGERFNAWTHLVGAVLAVAGVSWLLVVAGLTGDPWRITSAAVYGATLILLYLISMLYHSVRGRAKNVFRKLDHFSIYLLIAGSYTPFCLVTLRGPWGWSLFGVVWGLALIGILQDIRPRSPARVLSLAIYATMGWVVLLALSPLVARLGAAGFAWLAAGGAVYTAGIVFFVFDERFRHWHGIWHLFVLAGSAAHFLAIARYVVM
ncbi:PAQR family membrane homeostasis protein TrhA [Paracandidimonas soli]|uniref:Hemolysin III n=1 Tax=Paracandidimonas soli TaxID=1917182 RepID=A0A4R3V9F8_9BURK|nr:hemolysin III family protein [Paracandidimonas soli]TCV00611.1 hemolysin III [Paracandidimonas soli]